LSSVKPGSVLPAYSFIFWTRVICAFLGSSSRVRTAHMADISMVWGRCAFRDAPVVEVAPVDLDLLLPDRVVGDVDLDRPVAEGLHQLVVLELAVFGLVGVAAITSSMSVWGNFFGLILCSWDAPGGRRGRPRRASGSR